MKLHYIFINMQCEHDTSVYDTTVYVWLEQLIGLELYHSEALPRSVECNVIFDFQFHVSLIHWLFMQ